MRNLPQPNCGICPAQQFQSRRGCTLGGVGVTNHTSSIHVQNPHEHTFGNLSFSLNRNPNIYRRNEFPQRRLANVDAFCGYQFTSLKVEACPWLGHTPKGHLLDWPSSDGVHDRCSDTHSHVATGLKGMMSTGPLGISDPICPECGQGVSVLAIVSKVVLGAALQ